MESFSLLLKKAQGEGSLSGVKVSHIVKILHLFFVDDILIMKRDYLGGVDGDKLTPEAFLWCFGHESKSW
jgi:hypothetical protein